MTRAGPARILGLADRGHLGVGAAADIVVYAEDSNRECMFEAPRHVFKDGVEVVRQGELLAVHASATHIVKPDYDAAIERRIKSFFDDHMTVSFGHFRISEAELADGGLRLVEHACRPRTRT